MLRQTITGCRTIAWQKARSPNLVFSATTEFEFYWELIFDIT